jgi:hypothetical protein
MPSLSIPGRIILAGLTLPSLANAESKTVVPFVDGMTITTSDSVANVEVHAQSLGPGSCGVTFTTDHGDSTSFLAPPLVYSPWTVLASHTGSVSYTISDSVSCDTDVLAEVRYFKE